MTSSLRRVPTAVTALAAAVLLAGCGGEEPAGTSVDGAAATAATTSGPAASGDRSATDVMFVQMMLPHHAQAIEMSELVLGKADVDVGVTALAEQVVAAQQPEIEQMSGWLTSWGEDLPEMGSGMAMEHPMNGMLAQQDVDAIDAATGADASRLYLEGLRAHHEGAIEMATAEVADGSDPAVVGLAEAIITAQEAEITQITELLSTL